MKVCGYLIMEPGADRPYFSHNPPTAYWPKEGSKVFSFELDVPGFEKVDGAIRTIAVEALREDQEFTCPKCGSHAFGSSAGETELVRLCNGWIQHKRCNFSFSSTEDAKYFKGTGHFSPSTGIGIGNMARAVKGTVVGEGDPCPLPPGPLPPSRDTDEPGRAAASLRTRLP
jgi:hypothetical protein